MTEIATVTPFTRTTDLARPHQPNDQFDRMGRWLELFIATEQVAGVLARTQFVPEPMRGQPENIAAAMMRSLELGIDPLDGLSNIHVVKGKIGYSAEFMRRRILEAGHEIIIDESTDNRCKMRGRRNGSTEWQTVTFTEEQARKAKIQLGDYPADKLVARASSRLCRRVFPDVLAGAAIVDDFDDGDTADTATVSSRPVQRKRQPRKINPPAPAPAQPVADVVDDLLDDEPDADGDKAQPAETGHGEEAEQGDLLDDEPADDVRLITAPQLKKLSAMLRERGFDDRDSRHGFVIAVINRHIDSAKDLTIDEAARVIDVLENDRSGEE